MDRYKTVIYVIVQSIRNICILLKPFVPDTCITVNSWFGFDPNSNFSKIGNLQEEVPIGKSITITGILYPKIKPEEEHPAAVLDFKVGEIESCEKHPDSEKLMIMQVNFKTKKAQVVAGIAKWFKPEDLIGTKHMFLTNIKASKLGGIDSQAMIIAGEDESINKVSLVSVEGDAGDQIFVGDVVPNPKEIKLKQFEKFQLIAKGGNVIIEDKVLATKKSPVIIDIKDGIRLF
jgi:methionyl-tRNA synthetase